MLAPLPPSIRAGWAGVVAGWVLPCPPSLPMRGRGWGTRDSPYIRQPNLRPKLNEPRTLHPL
jgi:hypothetical protein